MNLDTFFEKFDLFADAPNAVAKMRELILHLAVRGQLLAQSRTDDSASVAIRTVCADTIAAIHNGVIRGRQSIYDADPSGPYELPSGWRWTRLTEVVQPVPHSIKRGPFGSAIRKDMFVSAGFKIYEQQHAISGDFSRGHYYIDKRKFEELSSFEINSGDIIISCSGTVGKVAIVPNGIEPGIINQALLKIRLHPAALMNQYFTFLFPAFFMKTDALSSLQGTAQKNIPGMDILRDMPFPLPPLAEQKRIVAKVDELMALCDRLEAQQQERETRHTALAQASLTRFTDAPTPANLNFVFNPSCPIPPADLRKSIITVAVQGKLIPQDPNETPAEQILRAGFAKRNSASQGVINNEQKLFGLIEDREKPFDLPPSWEWTRLGDIASIKHGFAFSGELFTDEITPLVVMTPGNFFECGGFRDRGSKTKYYRGAVDPEFIFKPRDLVIPMTEQAAGLLGSPAFIPDDGKTYLHNQRIGKLIFYSESIAPEFAFWFFNCEFFRNELANTCTGMKVRHTSPSRVLKVPFPVAPLDEQRRIVAKVEELMALVDRLEALLSESRGKAAALLEAVVAELSGAG